MNPLRAIDSMAYGVICRKHRTGGMDETFGGLGILRRQLPGQLTWKGNSDCRGEPPVSPPRSLPVNKSPN